MVTISGFVPVIDPPPVKALRVKSNVSSDSNRSSLIIGTSTVRVGPVALVNAREPLVDV